MRARSNPFNVVTKLDTNKFLVMGTRVAEDYATMFCMTAADIACGGSVSSDCLRANYEYRIDVNITTTTKCYLHVVSQNIDIVSSFDEASIFYLQEDSGSNLMITHLTATGQTHSHQQRTRCSHHDGEFSKARSKPELFISE